ncbi:MAG: glycosyltransferase family 2 protein [Bacteroidales bacterium]|jgi:hypothetical protein|nr:glycosyltransferase family 2 protein [Bacteroidales bacterium]
MAGSESMHRELCIILLNYFNDNDTVECVESVKRSENIELPYIVVTDNSDGQSRLGQELAFYPYLKILVPPANLGFGGGVNHALNWAVKNLTFEYLLVLNNDTLLRTDTLKKLVEYAKAHPSFSLITPCIITAENPPRIWYAGGDINFSRMTPVVRNIGREYNGSDMTGTVTGFGSGCAMLIVSASFNLRDKLFDPNIFIYDEDVELSIRLAREGKTIVYTGSAVVIHKCQGSQKKNTNRKINQLSPGNVNLLFYLKHTIRNRFYILNKHFSGDSRSRIRSSLILYWCLKSIQYAAHLRFDAFAAVLSGLLNYGWTKTGDRKY